MVVPVAPRWAAGCTPSSTSSTTATSAPATCSPRRRVPGDHWEKEGRSGKLVFSENITEYRDQNGELVITARGVGVRTERPVTQKDGE